MVDALLVGLRRGAPRATPFALAGTLDVAFDGSTCRLGDDAPPLVGVAGLYALRFVGPRGVPSGVLIGGVRAPRAWNDLLDWLPTVDLGSETAPPDWLLQGPSTGDEDGSGSTVTATGTLEPGVYGPICLTGVWPDFSFAPGTPFEVAAAAG